jgi:RNA polymerase sigma-70 factor (ECF subfamily)
MEDATMKKQTNTPPTLTKLLPALSRRARRLCENRADAEDLVHDTVVRVIAKQQQGAKIDDLAAYSMRTLHNQARMGWRRAPAPEELHEDDASTPPVAIDRLICADTLRAIEALPDKQARLLRMVSEGDTSPKVLADRTGWPVGTVMSRLARARARLKEVLKITE